MTLPDPSDEPASGAPGPATVDSAAPDRLDRMIDTLAENGYAIVPDFLNCHWAPAEGGQFRLFLPGETAKSP